MCLRATLTSERGRQCRRHLIYAHFASTQVSFERWRLHGILFRRWSGWHVSVKWMAEVCMGDGLLGSTLTRFDTRDGRERRRTLRSTIRGSNWWTNTCKRFDIPSLHVGMHTATFHPWTNPGIWNTCDVCSYQRVERKKGRNDIITMAIYFLVYFPFFFPLTRAYSPLLYTFYAVV